MGWLQMKSRRAVSPGCLALLVAILGLAVAPSSGQDYPDSVIATIPVGGDPTNVTVLPDGEYVYVGSQMYDNVIVVRVADRSVVARVPTGRGPWELMAHPGGEYVYVSCNGSNAVSVIRTSDNTVVATVPVGASPYCINLSPDGERAYVANGGSNTVSVIRTSDNTVVATVPVGGNPREAACLPNGEYVYVANCDGTTLTKIRTQDNTVVAVIDIGYSSHRVAGTLDSRFVYATPYGGDRVIVVSVEENRVVGSVLGCPGSCGIVMLPGTVYAYVANVEGNSLSVIRTTDHTLVATVPVGSAPYGAAPSSDAQFVYSGNRSGHSVTVIGRRVRMHDVGPVRILEPHAPVDSGALVLPRVVVRNFGSFDEVFPVDLSIGAGYVQTVLETLAIGQLDTVDLPAWVAGPVGTQPVTCFTSLAGDERRQNDTLRDSVRVTRPPLVDVGVTAILAPTGYVDSGAVVTPSAVVHNYGTGAAVFWVSMRIGSAYLTMVADTLGEGESDTVSFSDWTAMPPGTFPVVCYTTLAGDQHPQNDTLRDSVTVLRPRVLDVGVVRILAPTGTVDSGANVTPAVIVRNYGSVRSGFPVTMRVGTSYQQVLDDTLDPGESDTLQFSVWTATGLGRLDVTCWTALAGDEYPANDTARDTVRVAQPARHDMATTALLAPIDSARSGDTLVPRARIRNMGSVFEQFFPVRFRIGTVYSRDLVMVAPLAPESSVVLSFDPWVALSGSHVVSCSTMLATDISRANDKLTGSLTVSRQTTLVIDPDQSDRIKAGESQTYRFYAELDGDAADVVELSQPVAPNGWSCQLYDSADMSELTDTDADGLPDLGLVSPGALRWFSLRVRAPTELAGDTGMVAAARIVLHGCLAQDTLARDSAVLSMTLVPNLSIHNFPNPLADRTTFVLGLPDDGVASLKVYNRAGECICHVQQPTDMIAGVHYVKWDARNDHGERVAPGTYQYLLEYSHQGRNDIIKKKLVVTGQ